MSKRFALSFCLVSCILFFVSVFTGCERKEDTGQLSFGNFVIGGDLESSAMSGDAIQQISYISYSGLSAVGAMSPDSIPDGNMDSPMRRRAINFKDLSSLLGEMFLNTTSGVVSGVENKITNYFNKVKDGGASAGEDGWHTVSHFGDMYYKTRIQAKLPGTAFFYITNAETLKKVLRAAKNQEVQGSITQVEIRVYFGGIEVYEIIDLGVSPNFFKRAKFIFTCGTREFKSGWFTLDTDKNVLYDGTATLIDTGNELTRATGSFTVMNNGGAFALTGSVTVSQDGVSVVGVYGINLAYQDGAWSGTVTYQRPYHQIENAEFLATEGTSSVYNPNWVRESFGGSNGYHFY